MELELSPPPPVGHHYDVEGAESPALLRCSNALWHESPGGPTGYPSPQSQLPPKQGTPPAELPAKGSGRVADAGHLLTPPSWGASQGEELIAAHHSQPPSKAIQLQGQLPLQAQAGEEGSDEEGSFISFSVSKASLGLQPSGLLEGDTPRTHLTHFTSFYTAFSMPGEASGELTARTALGNASGELTARTAVNDYLDAADNSTAVWTGGHLFAPAANPRGLWSPSTQSAAHSPLSSSPSSATRPLPENPTVLGLGSQAEGDMPPTSGLEGATALPAASWQQLSSSRLGQRGNHPIFGLSRGGGGELGSAPTSLSGSAATSPTAVPAAADAAVLQHMAPLGAAQQREIQQEQILPGPGQGPLQRSCSGGAAMSPPLPPPGCLSPSLPPLHPSLSPTILPVSAHRRFHSALPPQLAHSGAGEQLGRGSLDRAWSVTNSHIDLKFDLRSIEGSGARPNGLQGGAAAVAAQHLVAPGLGSPVRAGPSSPLRPLPSSAASGPLEPEHTIGLPPGTYDAAFRQLKRVNISYIKRHVLSSPVKSKPATLAKRLATSCLNPVGGRLRWRLGRQRVRLACLGRLPYDPDNVLHYSIMQAVVTGFAGLGRGTHGWREAGFTSANPSATDLCGVGMLGLLHLVLLLEQRPEVAAELYRASAAVRQHPQQQAQQQRALALPPALLSVRVTLWTLQALKTGLMSRPAQRLKSTSTAAECFYLGAVECFLDCWREAGEGEQLWEVLQRAEQRAKHNVWPMIKRALPADAVVH